MFKFAPVFLKKLNIILLIKLFVSSVFLFMYLICGRESSVKGKHDDNQPTYMTYFIWDLDDFSKNMSILYINVNGKNMYKGQNARIFYQRNPLKN